MMSKEKASDGVPSLSQMVRNSLWQRRNMIREDFEINLNENVSIKHHQREIISS